MPDHPDGSYKQCYVAFLDILGFKDLIARSANDETVLRGLSRLTAVSARLKAGMKATDAGRCPMQTRSFSDCVVVFTPTSPGQGFATNSLAQLLFVVRFVHDEVLRLGACVRGGVTMGKMFWHPDWTHPEDNENGGASPALPLTFGPGFVTAYELESKKAKVPRVLIDEPLVKQVKKEPLLQAYPFGKSGTLATYFRIDSDGESHLDLLNPEVTRSDDEEMRITPDGFTIEWSSPQSKFAAIRNLTRDLAQDGITKHASDACLRGKFHWLLDYAQSYEHTL